MADTQPKVGIEAWLQSHLPYRYKVILVIALIAGLVIGFNWVRDLRAELQTEKHARATLEQNVQQLGTSVVTKNEFKTKTDAQDEAFKAQGQDVKNFARDTHSTLLAFSQGFGQIQAKLSSIGSLSTPDLTTHQDKTTGALNGFPMEEARTDNAGKSLPGLARVNISYDPTQHDANAAFKGTTWFHNRETFHPSFAQWKSNKDGRFETTLSLKRVIERPDPLQPGQWQIVGTEEIPVTDGSTVYTPQGLTPAPSATARWMALLGGSKDGNTYKPLGLVNYNFTDKYGLGGGIVAGKPALVFSVRFGAPKP